MKDVLTIENEFLSVDIAPIGAELRRITYLPSNTEILKPYDDPLWTGSAPLLFPICGRLWEHTTYVDGTAHRMTAHGFAASAEFVITEHTKDRMSLMLCDDEQTREAYPFRFALTVTYTLCGASLETRLHVENRDTRTMPVTAGFHPAFHVPPGEDENIECAYLQFSGAAAPKAWRLTEGGYLLPGTDLYPTVDGNVIPLSEKMFEANSSVFFEKTAGSVTLKSLNSSFSVRLDYPDAPYLGLWKPQVPEATFVCIEPWYSTPDYEHKITDLYEKRDMTMLPPSEAHDFAYTVTVEA
ncbi:MAG: aldose 1-epimerase family protein [Clostridia bacterium]|nr:aldose 1-epimerase family protein [Clostridia bacterium]